MTPREVSQQLNDVDRKVHGLDQLRTAQLELRRRYLLEDTRDAREKVEHIERGIRMDEGCWPELIELQGKPGLVHVEQELARLQERRAALLRELPSQAQTDETKRKAEEQAEAIRTRAARIENQIAEIRADVEAIANRALDLAQNSWQLRLDNGDLDSLCSNAGIARPSTPRYGAVNIPAAVPLAALLTAHFTGGETSYVAADLAHGIRQALTQRDIVAS